MTGERPPDAFVHRINRRLFYGWLLVAVGILILFASGPGQSHTFGVFLTYVAEDLHLSHTEISFAYGVATLSANNSIKTTSYRSRTTIRTTKVKSLNDAPRRSLRPF